LGGKRGAKLGLKSGQREEQKKKTTWNQGEKLSTGTVY
jgi:hypothetical protein